MRDAPLPSRSPTGRVVDRAPIRPERVRRIGADGFAFIPNRFLRDGFYAALSGEESDLYLLLALAGDRNGMSFYHYDSLCTLLGLPLESYLAARNTLIDQDLIAYDGTRFQVLSLPERPVRAAPPELRTPDDFAEHDRATIRATLRRSFRPGGTAPGNRTP